MMTEITPLPEVANFRKYNLGFSSEERGDQWRRTFRLNTTTTHFKEWFEDRITSTIFSSNYSKVGEAYLSLEIPTHEVDGNIIRFWVRGNYEINDIPEDPEHWHSYDVGTIIFCKVIPLSSDRIRVETICYSPYAIDYYQEVLNDIGECWPESGLAKSQVPEAPTPVTTRERLTVGKQDARREYAATIDQRDLTDFERAILLANEFRQVSEGDMSELRAFLRRARLLIQRILPVETAKRYLDEMAGIQFLHPQFTSNPESGYDIGVWRAAKKEMEVLLATLSEEVSPPPAAFPSKAQGGPAPIQSRQVFVVHGHDEAMKFAVERTLEQLDLAPVILEEQPSRGQTVIAKLHQNADVQFAVVCLSPDDAGYAQATGPEHARPRARQNVVFELGYFTARLGDGKVVALLPSAEHFEMPSDYAGVIYIPYDKHRGAWRNSLAKELRAAGIEVDENKLR